MSSPPSDNLLSVFRPDCLKDKVAILSGGGSGITFRIAEAFVSHGCSVVICSRSLARLEQAAEELRAAGKGVARCVPIQCDVRDENAVAALVKRTLAELGRIDILVNGAAGNFLAPAERLTANGMRSVLEIDVLGTFLLSKHVFSAWMKHHGGSIVNITATLHWNGELLQVHAGSAKAAIEAMTRHLANEWGKYGVRVNNIAPVCPR